MSRLWDWFRHSYHDGVRSISTAECYYCERKKRKWVERDARLYQQLMEKNWPVIQRLISMRKEKSD